jgi:branched-chain amino acid transport system substrate-binding protein
MSKNPLSVACVALLCGLASAAMAQDKSTAPVKIGVLGDMSGIYQGPSGKGAVVAVQLAVEDIGGKVLGRPIEVLSADHQNKTDVGSAIARRWYDQEGVSAIVDVVGSGVSLAVAAAANERKKVFLASNGATSALNMGQCNPYTVQWRSDTFAASKAITEAMMKTGAKTWFVVGADYNLGHALEQEMTPDRQCVRWKDAGKHFPSARRVGLRVLHPLRAEFRRPGCRARQCWRRYGPCAEDRGGVQVS